MKCRRFSEEQIIEMSPVGHDLWREYDVSDSRLRDGFLNETSFTSMGRGGRRARMLRPPLQRRSTTLANRIEGALRFPSPAAVATATQPG